MSSSISEEKENPVVTLRTQAKEFDFSKLRAGKDNAEANSGNTAFCDLHRMDFVINKKSTSRDFIAKLYKKHDSLLSKKEDNNKGYRPFAKEVFKEMFKYAEAKVPSDPILEELVTNCNQAGYEAGVFIESQLALSQHSFLVLSPKRVMNIDYIDQNNVSIRSDMKLPIFSRSSGSTLDDKVCDLSSSLEFTLHSQDGKDGATYKDGKLSLTIPEELKNFPVVNEMQQSKSLFDVIKEIFLQLIEKVFGHTNDIKVTEEDGTITMISSFSKPLKVNSTLKEIKPPINSIETILDK